jgi:uncharacterized protein YuzE
MHVTYDQESNAAYIHLAENIEPGQACTQEIVTDDIVLDYDDEGKLLGIEILHARRILRADVLLQVERMVVDLNEQELQ